MARYTILRQWRRYGDRQPDLAHVAEIAGHRRQGLDHCARRRGQLDPGDPATTGGSLNADELRSLFGNYGEDDVRTWLNGQGFSGIQLGYYWSSTTETGSTADAYCVNSEVGSMIGQAKSGTYRAIIVRGTSGNLPKTGQTTAYDGTRTDDEDGDLAGIALARHTLHRQRRRHDD